MSMTNSSDTIGNLTRDLPVYSAVPPHVPLVARCQNEILFTNLKL
jgi:hypothetical protein